MQKERALIVIPTFNEAGNISLLLHSLSKLPPDILVVDDQSTDGTIEEVRAAIKKNSNISLIVRKGKKGRGYAGIAGFRHAIKNRYDCVIEMDADLSHDPKDIPKFIKAIKKHDVVIGSRFIKKGADKERGFSRQLLSIASNWYIKTILGLKVNDCTSGYRCFRRNVLEKIDMDKIKARGPSVVQELLYKSHIKGFDLREIPISFRERHRGRSKLTLPKLAESILSIPKLRILYMIKAYR